MRRTQKLDRRDVDVRQEDMASLLNDLLAARDAISEIVEQVESRMARLRAHAEKDRAYITRRVNAQLKKDFPGCNPKLAWSEGFLNGSVYHADFEDGGEDRQDAMMQSIKKAMHKDEFCYLGKIRGEGY